MTTNMKATSPKIAQVVATNQPLVQALNTGVHTNQEVRQVVAKITGQAIDPSVEIRLPFYTDFGRHLHRPWRHPTSRPGPDWPQRHSCLRQPPPRPGRPSQP